MSQRVRPEAAGATTGSAKSTGLTLNFVETAGANTQFGIGDTEIGVKYRFVPATGKDWWPQVAFYPFFDFPTGNAERGLGTGRAHEFFPIWVQKDLGKWTIYGGGGYWINPGEDNKNFWFTGLVLQYQLTDELAFGGEIFHQTQSSTASINSPGFPLGTKDTTGFNFGGTYNFNKTYHLLFSFGRGLQNASTNNVFSYYLALQVTY